jgi:hypothetical protein
MLQMSKRCGKSSQWLYLAMPNLPTFAQLRGTPFF